MKEACKTRVEEACKTHVEEACKTHVGKACKTHMEEACKTHVEEACQTPGKKLVRLTWKKHDITTLVAVFVPMATGTVTIRDFWHYSLENL